MTAPLPQTVQDIADVIGREKALYLIGQLPVCHVQDKRYTPRPGSKGARRVVLYVPKRLKPDHQLVRILGWKDAEALVQAFGGEMLAPPTMTEQVYRPFRDRSIVAMHTDQGVTIPTLAEWFSMTSERVCQILGVHQVQTPQVARMAANDNDAAFDKGHKKAA